MQAKIHDQLTVDDLFRAADVIAAVLDHLDSDTLRRMQSGKADRHEIGRVVVTIGLRVAPQSGRAFLAGLCDMGPQQFGQLPADAVLDVAEQLKERTDVRDFFERARSLAGEARAAAPEPAEAPAARATGS